MKLFKKSLLIILGIAIGVAAPVVADQVTDVSQFDHPAYERYVDLDGVSPTGLDAILWAREYNITHGCAHLEYGDFFCPHDPVTRGSLMVFLHRLHQAGALELDSVGQ